MKNIYKKNQTFLILIFLAVLSFSFRFYKLSERFDWTGVEGSFIWDIWYVAQGHPTLIGFESAAIGHLNFPPFLLWFLTPFFILAQGNPIYIEIILALLGVLSSILFFLIGKKLFGFRIGLLASLIHIFSLHAIYSDKKFIGGAFMIPISLIVLFLIWDIWKTKEVKIKKTTILGSLLGISFSFHYQTIFLILGTLIFFVFYKREFFKLLNFLIFIVSVSLFLSPLLIFDLRHNFYTIRGFLILLTQYTNAQDTQGGFGLSIQYMLQNFLGIFWNKLYTFPFLIVFSPIILFIILLIFFLVFFFIARNKIFKNTKPVLYYFLTISFLGFFVLSFYRGGDYNFDYYYWFLIPVLVFSSSIIFSIFTMLKIGKFFLVLLLLIILFLNISDFLNYKTNDSYNSIERTIVALLSDAKKRKIERVIVKFEKAEAGAFDYLFYYHGSKFGFDPSSIILISMREYYQERSILGSGAAPIKILPKGAGKDLKADYTITREAGIGFTYLIN